MLAAAQGRAEAAAAAVAVVKVAVAVAAGGLLPGAGAGPNTSGVREAERDLRSAADGLLRRASAYLLAAAGDAEELPPQGEDLEGALLLVAALCAGCSPSFDEGGFAAGVPADEVDAEDFRAAVADGERRTAEEEKELQYLCRRAGLLGLPRSRVEAVAARVASLGPVIALLSPASGCRSAALRALAATGLPPPLGSSRSSSRGGGGGGGGGGRGRGGGRGGGGGGGGGLLLLLPASMAEGARADPGVAAAASALAPLVAAGQGQGRQGGGGERGGNGVEALYRALLAAAAGR